MADTKAKMNRNTHTSLAMEKEMRQNKSKLTANEIERSVRIRGLVSIFVIGYVLLWPLKHKPCTVAAVKCHFFCVCEMCIKRGITQIPRLKYSQISWPFETHNRIINSCESVSFAVYEPTIFTQLF